MSLRQSLRASAGTATLPLLCILSICLSAGTALAAPHEGDLFSLRQPDGSTVEVRVWGDEFYQRIESLDGYTLIRDPDTDVISYAELTAGGTEFRSTGIAAEAEPPVGLIPGLRLTGAARKALAFAARDIVFAEEAAVLADKFRDPEPSTLGQVAGITLIVDFSDVPGTVPAAEFEDYLNLPGYNGYNNNGSVRDYFYDVSDGLLEYTNFVPDAYYRASQPFTYYDDPDAAYGSRARELIRDALNDLNHDGFDFSQYDSNGDGFIDAVNIFYAGAPQNGWSVGMWPHSSVINWSADGVSTFRYQITNIGDLLRLSTFCHENGHMICFWPDLYDYDGDSAGVGKFCLMCSTGSGTNPVEPCAPLRDLAQWCNTTDLQGLQSELPLVHGINDVFKVPHPTLSNEYYMIENRQRAWRDAAMPDAGIAIWHVDLYGSNNNNQQLPGSHYFCTLVQADGRWDLEQNHNNGDSTDLWSLPEYYEFDPSTSPPATWWSGSPAPIYIDGISAIGSTMTFNYREDLGTMAVLVDAEPDVLVAPWRLEGPNDYVREGAGDDFVLVWDEGMYTLTWLDVWGWSEPEPLSETGMVVLGGGQLLFTGTYTDPPFVAAAEGQIGSRGEGVSLVDVDGDDDLDIYLSHSLVANELLRNDGGMTFVEIADGALADAGPTFASVWADYDNDGDKDVYLSHDGQANRLLHQDPLGTFTDIAGLGVDNAGEGRAVSWRDFDNDAKLDLYITNADEANVLFRNWGDVGMGYWTLLTYNAPALQSTGNGQAAPWCDYDANGFSDVYVVNAGTNELVRNWDGLNFEVTGFMEDFSQGKAATWGDIDADGDFDLYLANALGDDRLYFNNGSSFTEVFDPALVHEGAALGAVFADLDNDGNLDLYVAREADDRLYFGSENGSFTASVSGVAGSNGHGKSLACGDLDEDGGLDLVLLLDFASNVILKNTIVNRGHWLQLDLVGDGVTVNRDAIGATVQVVTGERTQLRQVSAGGGSLAQNALTVAFGLGDATLVDSIVVTWPGGETQTVNNVAADQRLTIVQGEATAAPDEALPQVTKLLAPWPNPFNPSTTIAFELARSGPVEMVVYGLDGRRVATLVSEERTAGRHEVTWQGRDHGGRQVASGAYLLRLQTAEGTWSHRLTLVK